MWTPEPAGAAWSSPLRAELVRLTGDMVSRPLLSKVLDVLVVRIGNFEAHVDTRLDQIMTRLGPAQ